MNRVSGHTAIGSWHDLRARDRRLARARLGALAGSAAISGVLGTLLVEVEASAGAVVAA